MKAQFHISDFLVSIFVSSTAVERGFSVQGWWMLGRRHEMKQTNVSDVMMDKWIANSLRGLRKRITGSATERITVEYENSSDNRICVIGIGSYEVERNFRWRWRMGLFCHRVKEEKELEVIWDQCTQLWWLLLSLTIMHCMTVISILMNSTDNNMNEQGIIAAIHTHYCNDEMMSIRHSFCTCI